MLPEVTNYGAFTLKTKAKKSHITNNSKKSHTFNAQNGFRKLYSYFVVVFRSFSQNFPLGVPVTTLQQNERKLLLHIIRPMTAYGYQSTLFTIDGPPDLEF